MWRKHKNYTKWQLKIIRKTVQINPENADAYHKRGIVKCKLGDIKSESGDAEIVQRLYHEGITDFDKYIHLTHPDNVNEPVADVESEKNYKFHSPCGEFGMIIFFAGSGFFCRERQDCNETSTSVCPKPVRLS